MDLGTFTSEVHHLGIRGAVARAVYYRAERLVGLRFYRLLSLDGEDANPAMVPRDTAYDGRMLTSEEVREYAEDPANELAPASVDRALRAGDRCFGILRGSVLASSGWYSHRPTTVLGRARVRFDDRFWYMYGGFTRPGDRGSRLHAMGLVLACRTLCREGASGLVTLAEGVNFASLRSSRRAGFRDRGTALVLSTSRATRVWQTTISEPHAIRVEAAP